MRYWIVSFLEAFALVAAIVIGWHLYNGFRDGWRTAHGAGYAHIHAPFFCLSGVLLAAFGIYLATR